MTRLDCISETGSTLNKHEIRSSIAVNVFQNSDSDSDWNYSDSDSIGHPWIDAQIYAIFSLVINHTFHAAKSRHFFLLKNITLIM